MHSVALLLLGVLGAAVATACDADPRAPVGPGPGRSEGGHALRGGGGGGGDGGGDASAPDLPDDPRHDVAEGACPLGAVRACRAVSDVGCLEGTQYCVDGVWSRCLRDVGGGGGG